MPTRMTRRGQTLVHQVLDQGLDRVLSTGAVHASDDAADAILDPADRWTCEYDLILASGLFEEFGYIRHYPENAWSFCAHLEGLRHFVRYGWRMLLNPRPDFDLWWYWSTYLDPEAELVNPLVHFLAEGRHRGHGTMPDVAADARASPSGATRWPTTGLPVRRVRRGRDRRRHRGHLRPRAEQVRRRLLPRRLCAGGRRAREARAVHAWPVGDPARSLRLRFLLRCWLATSWAGTPSRRTTSCSSSTTAAISCVPWTRCSTAWSRGPSTGGDCRPPTTTSRPAS